MTSQGDFGKSTDPELPIGEPELVPGSLRGFRMFRVSAETGRLKSMTREMTWPEKEAWGGTTSVARCDCAVARIIDESCECAHQQIDGKSYIGCAGQTGYLQYVCRCKRSNWLLWQQDDYEIKTATVRFDRASHNAPQKDCSCGFYASYSPEALIGVPGCDVSDYCNYALGVVEASGRVILGTKGFRAEKMRIVDTSPVRRAGWISDVRRSPTGFRFNVEPIFDQTFLDRYPPDDLNGLLPKKEEEPREESKDDPVAYYYWIRP